MDFSTCTILQTAQFYRPPKLVLSLGLTRRVDKSLHFLFAKGLETKSFLVALLLVTGSVLDRMKAHLVHRDLSDFLRCCFVLKQRKVLIRS